MTDLNGPEHTARAGAEMFEFIAELYPICRSITGEGVRQTLRQVSRRIPVEIHEVPSGTRAFDWTVPKEWNIRDAYISNVGGDRIVDFRQSNLHVVSYSVPVNRRMRLAELRPHLFSLPEHPDWIPYRTTYYKEDWGFCLPHRQLQSLPEGDYDVVIDSSLTDGHLTYGEYVIKGRTADEVLISTHVCHPSLCNDNLSGVALTTLLAQYLSGASLNYSYRFLFIPGTIGSITWLSLNEPNLHRIKHGLVVAGVGDPGKLTYKRSRRGDAEVDMAVINVLRHSGRDYDVVDFFPYGHDERQYCSPAFNLPVGCLSRTPHGRYPEYHTSADNLDLVQPDPLADTLSAYLEVVSVLEGNGAYLNMNPKGEPQLGRRGLYGMLGGSKNREAAELAMLWVLNLSDGTQTLLDISDRSGLAFPEVRQAADLLLDTDLLRPAEEMTQ